QEKGRDGITLILFQETVDRALVDAQGGGLSHTFEGDNGTFGIDRELADFRSDLIGDILHDRVSMRKSGGLRRDDLFGLRIESLGKWAQGWTSCVTEEGVRITC